MRSHCVIATLLLPVTMIIGCGPEKGTLCELEAGTYQLAFTRDSSDCPGDVIQPQWDEDFTVEAKQLRCGDKQETVEKQTAGANCSESCIEDRKVGATTLSGKRTCTWSCRGTVCKYSATFTTTEKTE